jgi:hypothetical protein
MPNLLDALLPEGKKYDNVIKVCDIEGEQLQIVFDILSQKVICFFT